MQLHAPHSVIHRKIQASTPERAMQIINESDDAYSAMSARLDFSAEHIFDNRAAAL